MTGVDLAATLWDTSQIPSGPMDRVPRLHYRSAPPVFHPEFDIPLLDRTGPTGAPHSRRSSGWWSRHEHREIIHQDALGHQSVLLREQVGEGPIVLPVRRFEGVHLVHQGGLQERPAG